MSLDDFYIRNIEQKKKGNLDLYKEILIEVLGSEIPWKEMKDIDRSTQAKILYKLEHKIKLKESPIDIKNLAYAIQNSRSGVGGSAMTNFNCSFCGTEELWSNTAVPNICRQCALEMAENIAKYHHKNLLKKEYRVTK